MPDTDILRRINNQRREYSAHPFRSGGAGMDDFAVLYARFQRVNDPELVQYLDLIDEMAPGHADCQACSAKILAFCERYTENRLPERYHLYVEQFQRVTAHRRDPRRDFRQEVRAHIGG